MRLICLFVYAFFFSAAVNSQENPVVIEAINTNRLIPEGIAVDERSGTMYVTSIAQQKIIEIKNNGAHRDFITTGKDGFGNGLGIKVDVKNNRLLAVSNKTEDKWFIAQLHVFDLYTTRLIKSLAVRDTVNHFFNDLALDDKGNAWITATEAGELYLADSKLDELKLLVHDTLVKYPNGIAHRNNKLYVATYGNGLLVYDIASNKIAQLKGYANNTYAFNLDGLGIKGNKLYGVYNTAASNKDNAVIEYGLNNAGSEIISEDIFSKGHPAFFEPTTLAATSDKLYVLANSHLGFYNDNKESIKGIEAKLKPVTVLVYKLK